MDFACGHCVWYRAAKPPQGTKAPKVGRGYCTYNPPAVFPMPVPRQNKIQALGQEPTQPDILPLMLRPVVEENEPQCGFFYPNDEVRDLLDKEKIAACEGSCEDCNCKEESDGS